MALEPKDLVVELAPDKLEASIKITNAEDVGSVSVSLINEALANRGVNTGIKEDVVASIVTNPVANTFFVVATGTSPTSGTDELVEYKFPITSGHVIEENESGSIDFRNISNFNNFKKDAVIATRTPATEGVDGVNVLGEVLPGKAGKSTVLRVGKGAEFNEQDQTVIACVAGHGCIVNDRVSVLNTVDIPAHVDYSVGNINFIGNLRIRGGIMPGFKVEAAGDIEIADNVENANITCGGNLKIQGIVFGHEDCFIRVEGDAEVNAVDQAVLEVKGDLLVHGYIRHCQVKVGGSIILDGPKGSIVGGEVAALTRIRAPFIGNNMATLTKLSVGSNPFAAGELDETQKNHDQLHEKLGQVYNAMNTLHNKMTQAGSAGARMQPMLDKLRQAKSQLEPTVEKLAAKIVELRTTTLNFKEAKIHISEKVFPGVVVNFRNKLQYKTMDEAQRLTFYEKDAEIRTGPL